MPRSLIHLHNWSQDEILEIFRDSEKLIAENLQRNDLKGQTAALIFFESSTRTRMSFETASVRLGLYPLRFDSKESTSLAKGETHLDSIKNIAAMEPKILVVRCGDEFPLEQYAQSSHIPIVNAGWGQKGHPTQALLDAWTLYREFASLKGLRVLFVGDLSHSRVVQSNIELLTKFGAELGQFAPATWSLQNSALKNFGSMKEALNWAQVVMALRVQTERHGSNEKQSSYVNEFQIRGDMLTEDQIVLHPGPVNWGVELSEDIANLSQCKILEQVSNGVYIRQTLLRKLCLDI